MLLRTHHGSRHRGSPRWADVCERRAGGRGVTRTGRSSARGWGEQWLVDLRHDPSFGTVACMRYLRQVAKPARTALVSDRADPEGVWREILAAGMTEIGTRDVHELPADGPPDATVAAIVRSGADAVHLCTTSPERAAAFATALARTGYDGLRSTGESALGPAFLTVADGWLYGTTWIDATADLKCRPFVDAYRRRHGTAPGRWTAEAYDSVRCAAHVLDALPHATRASFRARLHEEGYPGVTRTLEYASVSRQLGSTRDGGLFLYAAEKGTSRYLGRYADVNTPVS